MPRRTSSESPRPELTVPREEADRQLSEQIEKGQAILAMGVGNTPELESARTARSIWSDYNAELLRRLFTTDAMAHEYQDRLGIAFLGHSTLAEKIRDLRDDVEYDIRRLRSIKERLGLIPEARTVREAGAATDATERVLSKEVFVVHGHDKEVLYSVRHCIGLLQLTPVILAEQASEGQTIMEKLEKHADVGFAVVLLTPDDMGCEVGSEDKLKHRARQNVVFELGFFSGKLGRGRVCALHKGDIELPSDYSGVVWISMEQGSWALALARELRAAGLPADLNRLVDFIG